MNRLQKNARWTAAICALCAGFMNAQWVSAQGILEEVIVTAEKRETTLQDTAVSVTAFSQDDLERGLINNNMDIQMAVPNMLMTRDFFTTAAISIRGVGQLAVGSSADPGTGVHMNGVYLSNSRIFETEYFDTERVEVLRGPQGTLYGRNTTGGVINVITRKPEQEFGGFIDATYGDYDYLRTRAALNIPLSDTVWQRFSLFYTRRDGFVDNVFNGDEIDGRDMYALRSSTSFNFGDSTDATLVINYFDEDSDRMRSSGSYCATDPAGILGCLPNRGKPIGLPHTGSTVGGYLTSVVGLVTGTQFPANDSARSLAPEDPRKVNFDYTPVYETDETTVTLEINHDFGDLSFTSLSGYHEASLDARNDYDSTVNLEIWPLSTTYQRGPDGPSTVNYLEQNDRSTSEPEQYSQEFRLASDFAGDLNFLLGAFYLEYETETHYYVYSSALSLFGQTLGVPENQRLYDNDTSPYKLDTWALFGELYYDINERTSLTLGLRYTDESKDSTQRTIYLTGLANPNAPGGGYDNFKDDWQESTGRVNINYRWNDETLLHATVARSYKGGGFNPLDAESELLDPEQGGDPNLAGFEPEFINSIELGAKTRLFDNTLQANVTLFWYDYEDLQISKIVSQTSINENTDADIQGLEGEFIWAPDEHWNVVLNLSWLDTELGDLLTFDPGDPNQMGTTEGVVNGPLNNTNRVLSCNCQGIPVNIEGGELPGAPQFTSYLAVSYGWYLAGGMRLDLSTSYYYQDEFYTRIFNTEDDLLESWDVWNATVMLTAADESWYAEGWVRNINDDEHWTGQRLQDSAVGLFRSYQLLEPRTFGVTLGYRF